MQHLLVRLYGAILILGAVYNVFASRRSFGYFTWLVLILGVPAGIGLIFYRRWGRILGLLFFLIWLGFALVFLTVGKGLTLNNAAFLIAAVGGLWTVYRWE